MALTTIMLGLVWLYLLNSPPSDYIDLRVQPTIVILEQHALSHCRPLGVEVIPERNLMVSDGVTMPYPGGEFMMYDCGGSVFGIRVPSEQ